MYIYIYVCVYLWYKLYKHQIYIGIVDRIITIRKIKSVNQR